MFGANVCWTEGAKSNGGIEVGRAGDPNPGGYYFNDSDSGTFDELRLYDRTLSEDELDQLYAATRP